MKWDLVLVFIPSKFTGIHGKIRARTHNSVSGIIMFVLLDTGAVYFVACNCYILCSINYLCLVQSKGRDLLYENKI